LWLLVELSAAHGPVEILRSLRWESRERHEQYEWSFNCAAGWSRAWSDGMAAASEIFRKVILRRFVFDGCRFGRRESVRQSDFPCRGSANVICGRIDIWTVRWGWILRAGFWPLGFTGWSTAAGPTGGYEFHDAARIVSRLR
jgi:hypothetical protein